MLPRTLAYGTKVESSNARSYRTSIQPQNGTGTYNPNDTIIINIPTRNNLVMSTTESFLKFKCSITNGTDTNNYLRLDSNGAHGFIQRIRVFHGSNLLSDIDNYGVISKILMDCQASTDACYGKYNILAGTRSDTVTTLPAFTSAAAVTKAEFESFGSYTVSSAQINSGDKLNTDAITPVGNGGVISRYFCLNLISLVGTLLNDKYFPLFACTSAPLRVEIQLVNSGKIPVCSEKELATNSFTFTEVEYVAQFMELSDNAMSIINSSLSGNPLQFVFNDYRNYVYNFTLPTSATSCSMPIPAKFSSLKSILVALRDASKIAAITYFGYSCNKFKLLSYTFRVGSTVYPPKAPDNVPEFFSEVVKAIGSMSDLNHQPSIELNSYSQDIPAANNEGLVKRGNINSGSFYIGLDLENYVASDKSSIFAGYNSNTDDIYFIPQFAAQDAKIDSVRFDAFAMFDSVLVFENGTCYVKF